jgi:hypothetical protein
MKGTKYFLRYICFFLIVKKIVKLLLLQINLISGTICANESPSLKNINKTLVLLIYPVLEYFMNFNNLYLFKVIKDN